MRIRIETDKSSIEIVDDLHFNDCHRKEEAEHMRKLYEDAYKYIISRDCNGRMLKYENGGLMEMKDASSDCRKKVKNRKGDFCEFDEEGRLTRTTVSLDGPVCRLG